MRFIKWPKEVKEVARTLTSRRYENEVVYEWDINYSNGIPRWKIRLSLLILKLQGEIDYTKMPGPLGWIINRDPQWDYLANGQPR